MAEIEDYHASGFKIVKTKRVKVTYNLDLNFLCKETYNKHFIEGEIQEGQKSIELTCPDCNKSIKIEKLVKVNMIPVVQKLTINDHVVNYIARVKT